MALRLFHAIQRLENAILVLLLGAMITLAGAQIILRNIFDSGLSWSDPLLRVLVLWVGMFGAMIATQQDRHIRIDLLTRYIPKSWHIYTDRLTHLFSAVVTTLLTWHSGRFVYFEWQDGTTLVDDFPTWVAESVLPLGFCIMAIRFILLIFVGRQQEEA